MLGLFIVGLAGAIACYVQRNQLEYFVEDKLNATMYEYNSNTVFQKSWDVMQHEVVFMLFFLLLFCDLACLFILIQQGFETIVNVHL